MSTGVEGDGGGYTLPGYNYLGPGNDLETSGDPTNELDSFAKTHDEKYAEIENTFTEKISNTENEEEKNKIKQEAIEEIKKADEDFLKSVSQYQPESTYDSIAKELAYYGIELKYLGEKVLGPLYPKFNRYSQQYKKKATMDGPPTASNPSIIGTGIDNEIQTREFHFKKMFNFHIRSTLCTYKVYKPSNDAANGMIHIKTFIHTLPWHKLFMYLTHKEYDDILAGCHTARVKNVSMKIYNLGNRTPFVASSGNVQYANANSQTTIGIWENMDKHGMIQMGDNIKPETLYGKKLGTFGEQGQYRQIAGDDQSAACQGKFIDNRMDYMYHNGIYDLTTGEFKTASVEQFSYLPALIGSAKVFYNATNSIGLIYENSHTPKDGIFHYKNDAWRLLKYDYLKNNNPMYNVVLRTGEQTAVFHKPSQPIKYEFATVDNFLYNNWNDNPNLHFITPVGVGIIPLLSKDGNHENSILNIIVQTSITIEAKSHGGNILYTAMRNPQPNPTVMGYMVADHQFQEIRVGNQPIISSTTESYEGQPDPNSVNTEIATTGARRGREVEKYDDREIRAEQESLKRKLHEDENKLQEESNRIVNMEKKYLNDIKKLKEDTGRLAEQLKQIDEAFRRTTASMTPPPPAPGPSGPKPMTAPKHQPPPPNQRPPTPKPKPAHH